MHSHKSKTMQGLLPILSIFFPFFLLYIFLKKRIENHLPPGPPGIPIIGHFNKLKSSPHPHLYLWQLSKTYGPLMYLKLGFVPTVVVSSARMAKEVMKNHDLEFASRPSLTGQQKLSYNGLDLAFAPYNDYWLQIRKMCGVHLFSLKRVKSFRPLREDEVNMMIQKIIKCEGQVVNLDETFMQLTSSIICRVAFGKRYENEGQSRFDSLLREAQAMLAVFFLSDYFPMLGWVDRLSGLLNRLDKNFKELDEFYQEIIDDHLDPKTEKSEQEDMTDVLLKLKTDEGLFTGGLTWDHIKAVLMNMIVGGTDSSVAVLVWTLTALMKNPEVMKRVQEEIRNVVHKKKENSSHTNHIAVDEVDLENLPYLKAVVKETMRLYPPAALLLPRETVQDCNIDGYRIPSKTLVFINAWAIGRDPEAWDNPDEFLPERFLGSSIDFKGQDFELIPFGSGRRRCPGLAMGSVTVELALANLLYSFNWELPHEMLHHEDIDLDVKAGIIMYKKNALRLLATTYVPK